MHVSNLRSGLSFIPNNFKINQHASMLATAHHWVEGRCNCTCWHGR
jgi:hypothetical protein